jgi:hypothetical protein
MCVVVVIVVVVVLKTLTKAKLLAVTNYGCKHLCTPQASIQGTPC